MTNSNIRANAVGRIGWKYYNTIKHKAMREESGWSGLVISLAIAFFVVLASAQTLNLLHQSIAPTGEKQFLEQKIYRLENVQHINTQALENTKYLQLNLNI